MEKTKEYKMIQNYEVGDTFKKGNDYGVIKNSNEIYKITGFTDSKKSAYVQKYDNKEVQHTVRIGKYFGKPKIKIDEVIFWKI
tara:strand:- start:290 stop:538 length:249 start_codon:yes stop_codon:yes gene_type:complete